MYHRGSSGIALRIEKVYSQSALDFLGMTVGCKEGGASFHIRERGAIRVNRRFQP